MNKKCEWNDSIHVKPDGKNDLDPCAYVETEVWHNVSVQVLTCSVCGNTEVAWFKNENSYQENLD